LSEDLDADQITDVLISEIDRIEAFVLGDNEMATTDQCGFVFPVELKSFTQQILIRRKGDAIQLSFSGRLAVPYVRLASDLRRKSVVLKKEIASLQPITSEQVRQVKAIFQELISHGVNRDEALVMLGPLTKEITKYRTSFSIREDTMNEFHIALKKEEPAFMT